MRSQSALKLLRIFGNKRGTKPIQADPRDDGTKPIRRAGGVTARMFGSWPRWRPAGLAAGPAPGAAAMIWALIAATWIGICAAAPELIWRGLGLAFEHPSWADLVAAVLIGSILAFFIEPVLERAREMLHRARHPEPSPPQSHHTLFAIILSFVAAMISVGLHDGMIALLNGGHGAAGNGDKPGLLAAVLLTVEWAIVPFAITLAWRGATWRGLAVPLGLLGAASPFIGGWLFDWGWPTTITTAVPALAILAAGYVMVVRRPGPRALAACALPLAAIAIVWMPIALLIDTLHSEPGQFYGMPDFLIDVRFYIGWGLGLLLVPAPADHATRAKGMAP
jgi:hypothetical protein